MTFIHFHQLIFIPSTISEMWISYVKTIYINWERFLSSFSWSDSHHSLCLFLSLLPLLIPFGYVVTFRRSECCGTYIQSICFKITSVLGTVHPHISAPRTAEWAPESPWHRGWPVQASHQVSPSKEQPFLLLFISLTA